MLKTPILSHCTFMTILTLMIGTSAMAVTDAWMTDYDAALEKAKQEGKDLLVDFSGSDWCGWCIKLDKEVFSHDAFQESATNNFVLVLLDFPRKPKNKAKIPKALQKRNSELQEEFAIRGFPSVLLIGADGKPYARTGYQSGGVEAYLAHLDELLAEKAAREALQTKLEGATGLERASLLDELIGVTPADQQDDMIDAMKEIVALDAEDEAGLKSKYTFKTRMLDVAAVKNEKAFDKAETMYAAIIDELNPTGEQLQELYFQWGEIEFLTKDKPGVVECLTKALAAAPESKLAPQLERMIERFSPKEEEPEESTPAESAPAAETAPVKEDAPAAEPTPKAAEAAE